IRAMLIAKIRSRAIGIVLALVLAGGGLGAWQVFAHRSDPANPGVITLPADDTPDTRDAAPVVGGKVAQPETAAPTDGPTALVRGKALDAEGKPVPFAAVTALVFPGKSTEKRIIFLSFVVDTAWQHGMLLI